MASDSMTSDERVWAAIRLERPDRTPVIPTLLPEPAAGLAGVSQAEIANESGASVRAVFQVFDEYGGWDNPYPASYKPIQLQAAGIFPMRMKIPGRELAEDVPFQLDEAEILQPEDYEKIADEGFERFYQEDFIWRISDLTPDELSIEMNDMAAGGGLFLGECAQRNLRPFFLGSGLHPFFTLSLMRSMVAFTQDVYFRPEPVERAIARMTDDLIAERIDFIKKSGIDLWLLTEERAGGYFFPPRFFERFWWPQTKRIVEACWSEGIVTLFHLDTCWDKNIAYFRELPRGSVILELDGTTDIFAAKKALRDHACLKGDLSAALLSIGTPDEVEDYCKRLISEVGADGGFILGSGCSVPPTARPENFRAMIETGKRHRPW
jgi:uroporphyrinogen-III decarboxylase